MTPHSQLEYPLDNALLLPRLIELANTSLDERSLLQAALATLFESGQLESACAVQSAPPEWHLTARVGKHSEPVPFELAADALDRMDTVASGGWVGTPLDVKCALLVKGDVTEDWLDQLRRPLSAALRIVADHEQVSRRIRRLERILDITHKWGQSDCMESLLEAMAQAATELLGADRASIFLWDKANKMLVARPALGIGDSDELRIPDDTGIVGQVVRTRQPRRVGGGLDDDQIARKVDRKTGYDTRTLLCVPLVVPSGECLGAFEVLNKHQGLFTHEDELGLTELAAHAAVALSNTQQWEDLISKHQRMVEEAAGELQLIGKSAPIDAVRSTVRRIADTDLAILILGENGTGKEIVARSIHYLSGRREQPFIAVNCAALTETLLESELFGHEKGAFTDARETRAGKFELASGGTLFLDEIGDMSLSGQAKLLRVLEDKTVVRVGGSTPIHTEVRILAATNQDLGKMVREKKFREDLFFRLNVVSLELPPLRERGQDILLLSEHFLDSFCRHMGRKRPRFSPAATKRLTEYSWPGNVRELRNLMERLAYLTTGEQIEAEDLAFIDPGSSGDSWLFDFSSTLAEATRDFQQKYIQQMVQKTNGNMSKAAKRLGLHRSNLYRKMRQLELGEGGEEDGED